MGLLSIDDLRGLGAGWASVAAKSWGDSMTAPWQYGAPAVARIFTAKSDAKAAASAAQQAQAESAAAQAAIAAEMSRRRELEAAQKALAAKVQSIRDTVDYVSGGVKRIRDYVRFEGLDPSLVAQAESYEQAALKVASMAARTATDAGGSDPGAVRAALVDLENASAAVAQSAKELQNLFREAERERAMIRERARVDAEIRAQAERQAALERERAERERQAEADRARSVAFALQMQREERARALQAELERERRALEDEKRELSWLQVQGGGW